MCSFHSGFYYSGFIPDFIIPAFITVKFGTASRSVCVTGAALCCQHPLEESPMANTALSGDEFQAGRSLSMSPDVPAVAFSFEQLHLEHGLHSSHSSTASQDPSRSGALLVVALVSPLTLSLSTAGRHTVAFGALSVFFAPICCRSPLDCKHVTCSSVRCANANTFARPSTIVICS